MATVERRAALEVRFDGRRTLTGPAVTYGEIAQGDKGPERFESRAFVSGLDTAPLVLAHDRHSEIPDAEISDSPLSLEVRAELREGSAPLRLVRRGTLGGLSVGFVSLREYQDNGIRVVTAAHLDHVALVDRPAYAGSRVELRQIEDAWLVGRIEYGRRLACRCQGPTCDSVIFEPGSLDIPAEVLAINGPATRVLGSRRRGTLVIDESRDAIEIGLVGPSDGLVAREVKDAARVAPVHVRPILDEADSDFVEEAGIRRFSRASVRALLIKTAVADEGHEPVVIRGVTETRNRPRRRRIWL